MRRAKWICGVLVLLVGHLSAFASHIVGGEFKYTCLNSQVSTNLIRYQVNFKIYMDCINGNPQAISKEDTGIFVLYTGLSKIALDTFFVLRNSKTIIPPNFHNECINNPPNTCLLQDSYEFTISLPNSSEGYYIATNNCCRNASIVNIVIPDNTGASYYVFLPPRGQDNNSAFFTNVPPQIICINNPFVYDHSAVDPDGDSLSYEFGDAFTAQTINIPPNNIAPLFTPPPYTAVSYSGGYNAKKPMAGNPLIQINPTTGLITGTPNMQGRFVVAVYCHEWRNGVLINTVIREYQFVVANCSKAVVADIPQYSDEFNTYIVECKSYTVNFTNQSTGGFAYSWDFGVPSLQTDTSDAFAPTYTYPDTGTFVVKLVVNRNSTCPDSISRFVKVYPVFTGDFGYSGLHCPGEPIQFMDSSQGSSGNPAFWTWYFGDGSISNVQSPVHTYQQGGNYTVVLVPKNLRGCLDTVARQVFIEPFHPFAGNDTVIVKGEVINFNASGGIQYTWTPATNLSNPNIGNPTGSYPDTGHFSYVVHIVSAYQCVGEDTINVWVVNQSSIFVPTGFTPNGDGRNDLLKPIGIGYHNINYFRVFDRWGEQMFYTTHFEEGWDGNWKGKQAEIGTYFWILSMTNRFGREEIVKGDSALIR